MEGGLSFGLIRPPPSKQDLLAVMLDKPRVSIFTEPRLSRSHVDNPLQKVEPDCAQASALANYLAADGNFSFRAEFRAKNCGLSS